MSAQLPQASLRQLKNQAKDLHRAFEAHEPQAVRRVRLSHPRHAQAPEAEVAETRLALQDAQLVIARECGFDSWPKLAAAASPEPEVHRPEGGLIGDSVVMQRLRAKLERASAAMVPVLLVGEWGVGKRLAARSVHLREPRREAPLVQVACGAPDGALGKVEVFGYEPGAFTGAHRTEPAPVAVAALPGSMVTRVGTGAAARLGHGKRHLGAKVPIDGVLRGR